MEKQHNRGQDGAGIAVLKTDVSPGRKYIYRERSAAKSPIEDLFFKANEKISRVLKKNPSIFKDTNAVNELLPFVGTIYLGHLRYGTYGKNSINACHPFVRKSNWLSKI